MSRQARNILTVILTVTVLWFYMFSPWTHGWPNFWVVMACSAVLLTSLCLSFTPDKKELLHIEKPLLQLLGGILLAFALWGIFWIGDKLSSLMFNFARPEVDAVYAMKQGLPVWLIAVLLLFVIGPAEEFVWRGFIQKNLAQVLGCKHPENVAFALTALVYAFVHLWSFNFMLIMAALVAGLVWGFVYRICPKALPALIVSHALWDVLVFVVMPI